MSHVRPLMCILFLHCLCRYDIMLRCWMKDPAARPSFHALHAQVSDILDEIEANVEESVL